MSIISVQLEVKKKKEKEKHIIPDQTYTTQRAGMGWQVRGRFKREETHIYLWLIHVDVWQKPTQYCKAIILQLKMNTLFKNVEITVILVYYYFLLCKHISSFIKEKEHKRFLLQKLALWITQLKKKQGFLKQRDIPEGFSSAMLSVSLNTRQSRERELTRLNFSSQVSLVLKAIAVGSILSPQKMLKH